MDSKVLKQHWQQRHLAILFGPNFDAHTRAQQEGVSSHLQSNLDYTTDLKWAKSLKEFAQVKQADPKSFLASIHSIGPDLHVLLGPRYKGGDRQKCFIEVVATNRPLSPEDLEALWDCAQNQYAKLKPRQLRFFTDLANAQALGSKLQLQPDLHLVTGPLGKLRKRQKSPLHNSISLQKPKNLSFFEHYLQVYKELHQSISPEMQESVNPEDKEGLQLCLDQGLLFEARVNGQWAGLISARAGDYQGLHGIEVVEEILSADFRGKGLGPALQGQFIDLLPGEGTQQVFGTILDVNKPSLSTAYRIGRHSAALSVFYPPISI